MAFIRMAPLLWPTFYSSLCKYLSANTKPNLQLNQAWHLQIRTSLSSATQRPLYLEQCAPAFFHGGIPQINFTSRGTLTYKTVHKTFWWRGAQLRYCRSSYNLFANRCNVYKAYTQSLRSLSLRQVHRASSLKFHYLLFSLSHPLDCLVFRYLLPFLQ
jgi:hypothetical protein